MFKIKVIKNNEVTHQSKFETQEEVQQWISFQESLKAFGEPQWIEQIEEVFEVKDEAGVVIIPAQAAYQIVHPAEYEIIVEDISAQIAAEQAQIDAIKAAQQQAGMRLMLFPVQVEECQDLDALKLAIKQMVSDIAVLLVK